MRRTGRGWGYCWEKVDEMSDGIQALVAGGLVYRFAQGEPEVLVIDDAYGYVALPKGHVEEGELLEEAALREINEETGIAGRIVAPLAAVSYSFSHRGRTEQKTAYYYLVEALGGKLRHQAEEIAGARYVAIDETERIAREQGYPNNLDVFARGIAALRRMGPSVGRLGMLIDHTLLAAEATPSDVERVCREARAYRFASVCVNPVYVRQCAQALSGSSVKACTVIGFPLGASTMRIKAEEARAAVEDGAEELDVVIALGALRASDANYVKEELRAVVEAADGNAIIKAILETAALTDDEMTVAARCALEAGAHFVKTSTGFSNAGGASVTAVRRLRQIVGDVIGVKASGGVRTPEAAYDLLEAGATRIGTSAGTRLVELPESAPW